MVDVTKAVILGFCLIIWILLAVVPLVTSRSANRSIFESEDNLSVISNGTFGREVFSRNTAHLVLFYAHWCGHCQRFAPTFKQFATDISGWQPVVEIGAVDCADQQNTNLCAEYQIKGYPSLKLFWVNTKKGDLGEDMPQDNDIQKLRKSVVDFIEAKSQGGEAPAHFPSLAVSKFNTLEEAWTKVPSRITRQLIVIEDANSYVGRELALDLSSNPNISVIRFMMGNGPEELRSRDKTSLFMLERGVSPRHLIHVADNLQARQAFGEKLEETGIHKIERKKADNSLTTKAGKNTIGDYSKVYIDDLEAGIEFTLKQEIGVHHTFEEKEIGVLRSFLSAIADNIYLPPRVVGYLRIVETKFGSVQVPMSRDKYLEILQESTSPDHFLRENLEYVGCRGSLPNKRGYTCSLWSLLHAITAGSHQEHMKSTANSKKILLVVKDYVLTFFSCNDCKEHFAKMAANLDQEVLRPEDAVLWLWKAHNQVNRRTAGDPTEDPERPKIQFPPSSLCGQCRKSQSEGDDWDEPEVVKFLHRHYGPSNFVSPSASSVPKPEVLQSSSAAHETPGSGMQMLAIVLLTTLLGMQMSTPLLCGMLMSLFYSPESQFPILLCGLQISTAILLCGIHMKTTLRYKM